MIFDENLIFEIDTADQFVLDMLEIGYIAVKKVPDGEGGCSYVGIMRFIFTIGLCYGMDDCGYKKRYCYSDFSEAAHQYNKIESANYIPENYIVEK